MPRIVVAACFLVLLTLTAATAADSSRGLLSAREVEQITARKAYASTCTLVPGVEHLHVYHIYEGGSGAGLSDRNAGDTNGDLSFCAPRGFQSHYKGGYITMVHVGVRSWGKYLHCNHASGSQHYTCDGLWPFYPFAGRESVSATHKTGHGEWYSFPAIGKNTQWWEGTSWSGACARIRVSARCLFDLMAKAGDSRLCPNRRRGGAKPECIAKLSLDQQHQIWDHAIWNGGCPRHVGDALDATSDVEMDDPVMPESFSDDLNATLEMDDPVMHTGASTNASYSEAPPLPVVVEALAPKENVAETTLESTDKGAFIV